MFDTKSLKELAAIEVDRPILSVYLDVDPMQQRAADEHKLRLREMLKQVEDDIDQEDAETVKRYLDLEYDWSGRGLVMFSQQALGIWYAFPLAVPVRSGVTVALRPYISPLVELDGLYGRYAVALVDRQGARFFLFQMGDLVAQQDFEGEDVRHTRKGGGSSVVGMRGGSPASGRREAELVQRNLKDAVGALGTFCQTYRPRRLLLAGAEATVAQFRDLLPQPVQGIVVGDFTGTMDDGENEIRDLSFEVLRAVEAQRQKQMVEAVVTAAAKGLNGVVGLDDTLSVAHEGRVQVLVVERDYHAPGYRCGGCSYLTTQPLEQCVFCAEAFIEIPDAVEAVVSQVVEKGGTVEVVDDETMGDTRIGALLRY